jgi:hypothetical protein
MDIDDDYIHGGASFCGGPGGMMAVANYAVAGN